MTKIYKDISELIGRTPTVELERLCKREKIKAKLYAKLEYFNPSGSIKDRAAAAMIQAAEQKGQINSKTTIIEPTSGNTGIGLAMIAAIKGYNLILTMPETMSKERQRLLKAYGAKLILTQGALGMKGAIDKAEQIAKQTPNSIILGQFVNEANVQAHLRTTGPEIFEVCDRLDFLVCGVGTGGTITGAGRYLKSKKEHIQIIAVEPALSPVLSKNIKGSHKIQGIGAGFVPQILDINIFDEVIAVDETDSFNCAKMLARTEGILAGISSGAALCAAIEIAKRPQNEGKAIVVILPDTGERYLSTDLFDSV